MLDSTLSRLASTAYFPCSKFFLGRSIQKKKQLSQNNEKKKFNRQRKCPLWKDFGEDLDTNNLKNIIDENKAYQI